MFKFDAHEPAGQTLEDMACAYWISDALFTALTAGLFDFLDQSENKSAKLGDLAAHFDWQPDSAERFLKLLRELGLVDCYGDFWFNTGLSQDYLVKGAPHYQGGNILWRKDLKAEWDTLPDVLKKGTRTLFPDGDIDEDKMRQRRLNYLRAMDAVIAEKIDEMLPMILPVLPENAKIADVGCGSGRFALSFLEKLPNATADLIDIVQMGDIINELLTDWDDNITSRTRFVPQNILDTPWEDDSRYDLIILSNIIHATGEAESKCVIVEATRHLTDDGIIIAHDFFLEHRPLKSHLSDINMMVNTYNGRAYDGEWVKTVLEEAGLVATYPNGLSTDTAVLFAAKEKTRLDALTIDKVSQLITPIKDLGFLDAIPFDPQEVVFGPFARPKCHFGCESSGTKTCSVNDAMSYDETKAMIQSYHRALLLRSEPPTRDFQHKCLAAEAEAFKAGFYKAFVFWAGPCSICDDCPPDEPCKNKAHHRPSMEGSGIDVFATTKKAGEALHTLKMKGEVIKYYALLLLE